MRNLREMANYWEERGSSGIAATRERLTCELLRAVERREVALRALARQWFEEAKRLDSLGQQYYKGEGSAHPPEWIEANSLRARANALTEVITRDYDTG